MSEMENISMKQTPMALTRQPSWPHRYVYWARKSVWVLLLMYLFMVAIPTVYEMRNAELPPIEQSNVSNGVFNFEHLGKGSYSIRLSGSSDIYSCRTNVMLGSNCFGSNIGLPLSGKDATVRWVYQSVYPFTLQKRVLSISIDGKEVLSYENVLKRNARNVSEAPYWALGILILLIAIVVIVEFSFLRKIDNE